MTENYTPISELGEFGLIERISQILEDNHEFTLKGIGDDTAIFKPNEKAVTLFSQDLLLEGVHFDLSYFPLKHLGYKSIAVNVSDIAAMYGVPKQVTIGLGISSKFTLEAIEEFYKGVIQASKDYNIDVVGGDISFSKSGFVVSVSIIGEATQNEVVMRSNAKKNDVLCVTGDLGGAYMGLQILEREKQVFLSNPTMQPELDKYQYVVGRQLRPKARMDIIYELKDLKVIPTSMIDISDGLASEILHLSKESNVGFCIYEEKIPIDEQTFSTAAELNIDPNTCALNGGEDYELLFTVSQEDFKKIELHDDIHPIGFVQEKDEGNVLITRSKNIINLKAQGWKHF